MKQTHMPYGFISGLGTVILSLVIYLTGKSMTPGFQYIAYIPFCVGIILNAIAFSKANDGFVTFGNIFASCFKASMLVAIVIIAWSLVSIYAFPEMKEKAITAMHEQASKNKNVTDDQIETSIRIMTKYYGTMIVSVAIFSSLFWGALFSLIGAIVAKKKGAKPFAADNF